MGPPPRAPDIGARRPRVGFPGPRRRRAAIVLATVADDAPDDLVADASWAPLRAAGAICPPGRRRCSPPPWLWPAGCVTPPSAPPRVRHPHRGAPRRLVATLPGCGRSTPAHRSGRDRAPHVGGIRRPDPARGQRRVGRPEVLVLRGSPRRGSRSKMPSPVRWGKKPCRAARRRVPGFAGVAVPAFAHARIPRTGLDDADPVPRRREIVEVRWFTRDDRAALRGESDVTLPGAASIARRLIDDWYRGSRDRPTRLDDSMKPARGRSCPAGAGMRARRRRTENRVITRRIAHGVDTVRTRLSG